MLSFEASTSPTNRTSPPRSPSATAVAFRVFATSMPTNTSKCESIGRPPRRGSASDSPANPRATATARRRNVEDGHTLLRSTPAYCLWILSEQRNFGGVQKFLECKSGRLLPRECYRQDRTMEKMFRARKYNLRCPGLLLFGLGLALTCLGTRIAFAEASGGFFSALFSASATAESR
jgi:hypothetical protein